MAARMTSLLRVVAQAARRPQQPPLLFSTVHRPFAPAAPALSRWPSRRAFSTAEKVTFTFVDGEGESTTVTANEGQTLLDVAHENDVELEGACGGELACSTCHLVFEKRVFDTLPEISEEEEDMLDLAWGLTDTYVGVASRAATHQKTRRPAVH
ncbi:hypothetical protein BBJ28_00024335 [Nothophytophthora sp. Chile5]|nr:hypothetical protein BBJ28_00024335 [Nothophytophthora sp. Chile5]